MTGRDEGREGAHDNGMRDGGMHDGGMHDGGIHDGAGGGTSDDADVVAPLARWLLWADSPAAVERLIRGLYVICALLVAFELFWHRHTYVPGEELFGYHAIVGFFAFMLIVLGAKQLRRVIRRDENYYAPQAIDAERYPEAGHGNRHGNGDTAGASGRREGGS